MGKASTRFTAAVFRPMTCVFAACEGSSAALLAFAAKSTQLAANALRPCQLRADLSLVSGFRLSVTLSTRSKNSEGAVLAPARSKNHPPPNPGAPVFVLFLLFALCSHLRRLPLLSPRFLYDCYGFTIASQALVRRTSLDPRCLSLWLLAQKKSQEFVFFGRSFQNLNSTAGRCV